MRKQSKTYLVSVLLALLAIGLIVFDQLSPSQQFHSPSQALEEVDFLQAATDTQDKASSIESALGNFPLQALKAEETNVSVNQRLRTTYSLFSIAPLLFNFEAETYQLKAHSFYAKPLCVSAPIYILFRQILV